MAVYLKCSFEGNEKEEVLSKKRSTKKEIN